MVYKISGKTLVWDFDPNETNAANLRDNNLYLTDGPRIIWNMSDTVKSGDCCTGVNIMSNDTFYFYTFWGFGVYMRVEKDGVMCIKKSLLK